MDPSPFADVPVEGLEANRDPGARVASLGSVCVAYQVRYRGSPPLLVHRQNTDHPPVLGQPVLGGSRSDHSDRLLRQEALPSDVNRRMRTRTYGGVRGGAGDGSAYSIEERAQRSEESPRAENHLTRMVMLI